jgi:hypothetical protein
MSHHSLDLSRRQLLVLAGAAARLAAAEQDFWDTKPPEEWSVADIYQLVNRSPWAKPVRGFVRPAPRGPDLAPRGRPPLPDPVGPNGVVTWESSQAVRDALKTPLPGALADCYVIGVDGIPLGTASTDDLQSSAALHSSGKVKWTVRAQVVLELIRTSPVYALGFSRTAAPIGLDSGEIVFDAQFGRWLVEARFEPRKMLYHGQLAV